MAKITSKPKKTPEQEAKELEELLAGVSVTSGAGMAPQHASPSASANITAKAEQKGENAPATPPVAAANPAAPAVASSDAAPAPATETPSPVSPPSKPAPVGPEVQAVSTAPAPAVAEVSPAPAVARQPAPPLSPPVAPAPAAEVELTDDEPETGAAETESGSSSGGTTELFDLASLFVPNPPGSKKSTCRLTAQHHQYLLMLGTLLGNGMSPPEILHNIVEQFIASQDKQVQKAITKQMRQVRYAAASASKKS